MIKKSRSLIVGNWKMNGQLASALALVDALLVAPPPTSGASLAVCPPFPYLCNIADRLTGAGATGRLMLGAQDCAVAESGAYTGDVSAAMLKDCGCSYVIIGHSERRVGHGESDEMVARKLVQALDVGLNPIICVGETLAERQSGDTKAIIARQTGAILDVLGRAGWAAQGLAPVIAYEPVWAIGTGLTPTGDEIADVHASIRRLLNSSLAEAGLLRIIYGGSVKLDNAASILALPDVDGALVGGASLDAGSFLRIAEGAKV